jgi:hypothetical protein
MKLSILMPLPLGLESLCELADVRVTDGYGGGCGRLAQELAEKLPEGFAVSRAYLSERPPMDIKWITYRMRLERAGGFDEDAFDEFGKLLDGRALPVEKKTKRGVSELDIAPHVKDAVWEPAGAHMICCTAALSAGQPSINPSHFAEAVRRALPEYAPDAVSGTRISLWDAEMNAFF